MSEGWLDLLWAMGRAWKREEGSDDLKRSRSERRVYKKGRGQQLFHHCKNELNMKQWGKGGGAPQGKDEGSEGSKGKRPTPQLQRRYDIVKETGGETKGKRRRSTLLKKKWPGEEKGGRSWIRQSEVRENFRKSKNSPHSEERKDVRTGRRQ